MIRLSFVISREVFRLEINNREIFYSDRIWKSQVRLIPKDEAFMKKVVLSRNKIPRRILDMFTLTKEEEAEYNNAKDDTELAEICIKDCSKKGARLIRRIDIENGDIRPVH